MEVKRKSFQGVLNILSFNRHFYIFGLITLLGLFFVLSYFNMPVFVNWIILVSFLYGLTMPLIVSAYVYDFSGYYNFNWLKNYNIKDGKNNLILNINAGFDETSFILKNNFPLSYLKVFDFYNAEKHTEPAIVRARKVSLVYSNTEQIVSNKIPLLNNSVDAIFLLSAAHEIRSHSEKVAFLKECHRVCKLDANIIMVEHLRDFPNFVAFTIGFTHFFSSKTWRTAFSEAGFKECIEKKFTPFMSIFNCRC